MKLQKILPFTCLLLIGTNTISCTLDSESLPLHDLLPILSSTSVATVSPDACEKQGGTSKCIFVSLVGHNGDFNSIAGAANGINGADLFCESSAAKPSALNGTYKAMLRDDGTNRGVIGAGVVINSTTSYYRYPDAKQIGVTGASDFDYATGLTNPFVDAPFGGFYYHWTGASDSAWTLGNHCANWTSNATGSADIGISDATGTTVVFSTSFTCSNITKVVCVQQ